MSTWSVPITWVNGAVTASQMNTLRDNLNFLKGFADLITGGSTADTGTGTRISITRPLDADNALEAQKSGDTWPRFVVEATGAIRLGDGVTSSSIMAQYGGGGITFPRAVQMASILKMPTKAGAWNDTDIPGYYGGSSSGLMGIDTTNSRIYVRVGTVWKFAALT